MKSISKIIHEIEFGAYRQELEISFDYDSESTENVKLALHTYKNGKYIESQDVTKTYSFDMLTAMIDSIDLDAERQSELDAMFDSPLEQIDNFLK